MRAIAIVLAALLGLSSIATAVNAQSNDCKKCREQQQACAKNYSAKTCKTEYDICVKGCKK